MTQHYVVGQFSVLLGDVEAAAVEWQDSVRRLRLQVEASSLALLPALAEQALSLTDAICWAAVEQGDVTRFCSRATSAAHLAEFLDCAGLLRQW
jgi:hypothetical protein